MSGPWSFEDFAITVLALIGLWFVMRSAIDWLSRKGIVDDGRR